MLVVSSSGVFFFSFITWPAFVFFAGFLLPALPLFRVFALALPAFLVVFGLGALDTFLTELVGFGDGCLLRVVLGKLIFQFEKSSALAEGGPLAEGPVGGGFLGGNAGRAVLPNKLGNIVGGKFANGGIIRSLASSNMSPPIPIPKAALMFSAGGMGGIPGGINPGPAPGNGGIPGSCQGAGVWYCWYGTCWVMGMCVTGQ